MSPELAGLLAEGGRFPRVSGDEPGATMEDMQAAMFSPRERG